MNILITLPRDLIEKIISGKKKFEMRKCMPKNMEIGVDGFFVVEKGTNVVRCWCRVDQVRETYIDYFNSKWYAYQLCVTEKYVIRYAKRDKVYLWKIGKVKVFEFLHRNWLNVYKNPQQFAYCSMYNGESY